jgi:hypothetical protein
MGNAEQSEQGGARIKDFRQGQMTLGKVRQVWTLSGQVRLRLDKIRHGMMILPP